MGIEERPAWCEDTENDALRKMELIGKRTIIGMLFKQMFRKAIPLAGEVALPDEVHAPTLDPSDIRWVDPDVPGQWCSEKEGCGPHVRPFHIRDTDPRCGRGKGGG